MNGPVKATEEYSLSTHRLRKKKLRRSPLLLWVIPLAVSIFSIKSVYSFAVSFGGGPFKLTFQADSCLFACFQENLVQGGCESNRTNGSRRKFFESCLATTTLGATSVLSGLAFAADETTVNSIVPCKKDPGGSAANCVSSASVRQVDLYVAPWTWIEGTSVEEVVGRLKGAIESDSSLTMTQNNDNRYFRVKASRNFAVDEIQFLVNEADRVITLRSEQIEGPDVTDLGMNRKRLDEIRKRTQVLRVMGEEFASADSAPREGAVDQLRAFWGYQSGSGYESILLDEDED
jgi:uncharacterized protein (DUF1499 family)